jgi:hypothetical protein
MIGEIIMSEQEELLEMDVNGSVKKVTKKELDEFTNNPKNRVVEVAPNKFKLLEKMLG